MEFKRKKTEGPEGKDPKAKVPGGPHGGNGTNRKSKNGNGQITPTGQRWLRDLPRWMQDNIRSSTSPQSRPRKGNANAAT